ncbi:Fe(3+) ABC transporter substrate-binding protein [Solemya velum gill symbiont]|uniref:Fe(3+) ABC transporter substrate-binding protein n=1 Tax=Solemya velum gill symbiont TaxID=2340 RepID=UPI0009964F77|nr:Fe(3+) ABC transporter substrate-binding protein [Solemya velum gill symbiont]OOY65854.1 Fe(3+) ABC transporter substrate-binding protein [Solemya velum gill symbiont]OOY67751.1 Fe(3+) ABC transporter substrate-binding protein [Solemya velum gill symbiont]OOY70346.1 Fe(3+) ABC transporter substrate-binding protein [Solemya velum gill symbiont]OOY79949.1 Fe(3+) ABC transporter substrate-binding protein [Solemya velum gill symbiont]
MNITKALFAVVILLFGSNASMAASEEANLYSARKEALIKPLLDQFTRETGIKVNLVTGKADALLKRLQSEGANSPADLLITTDSGRLHRAHSAGLLQQVKSEKLNTVVPPHLRNPEGYWFGLSVRARPIFYAKDRVKPEELSTYEALTDKKWKGRICIRSSNNIYNQSLVASMIAHNGAEATQQWADAFVGNFARPPKGGDRDQIKAAAAGQCDIAIANTYYYGGMLISGDYAQIKAANSVAIFWPNQDGRGTHVNVSGVGVTKAATNRENAIKLIEFLVSPESQLWYAEANNEYPVVEGAGTSEILKSWGDFKPDNLSLARLGELNADAVRLMDRAGWR